MKKLLVMLFTFAVAFSLAMPVFAQDTGAAAQAPSSPKKTKAKKAEKTKKTKRTMKPEQTTTTPAQ